MTAADDRALGERCARFAIDLSVEASEAAAEHSWGISVLNPSIPLVWDANQLHITDPGLKGDEIVYLADEILGGAGMAHRSVNLYDEAAGERVAPAIERLGWKSERTIDMVLEGEPATGRRDVEVTQHPQDEIEGLRRRLITSDLEALASTKGDVMVAQLLEWGYCLARGGGDLWLAAAGDDGEPASSCRLLGRDGAGQIEDVGTIEHARERGLGGAVTAAAARLSIARGDDLTFITALADDWPRLMYERMGFRPVSIVWTFRRKP